MTVYDLVKNRVKELERIISSLEKVPKMLEITYKFNVELLKRLESSY